MLPAREDPGGHMELSLRDLIDAAREHVPDEEVGRHELTNAEWRLIAPALPRHANRRGRPKSDRLMLNGMLWILRTGAPWRDLPERYGPWSTVWSRFRLWRALGVMDEVKRVLLQRLNDAGELDWDLWCVDGTSARASRSAAGAQKRGLRQRSRRITRSACPEEGGVPRSTS